MLLPILLLPVSHDIPSGKASLKSLGHSSSLLMCSIHSPHEVIGEQMAWTEESTLAVFVVPVAAL